MTETPYESDIVTEAFNAFMMELFGELPKDINEREIDRDVYTKAMERIQDKFGLVQGHPQHLEFVLTLLGRSPKFTKGAEDSDRNNEKTMG